MKWIAFVVFLFVWANLPAQDLQTPLPTDTPERLLSRLVQFRSISGQEGEAGKFLVEYCQRKNLHVHILTDKPHQYNFIASLYPLDLRKPNIMLQSHIDVVPAGQQEEWIYPPFSGTIDSVAVWGRGAIDCKGLLVMQLWALVQMIETTKTQVLPYNISLLVLSGEETGGKEGAQIIVENYLPLLNPVVVFGEGGAGLQNIIPSKPEKVVFGISVSEKSSLWLRVSTRSKRNGHGSVPPKLYATKRLLRGLINVMNYKPKTRFSSTTREMFRVVGKLEGGFKGFVIRHANKRLFRSLMRKYFEEGADFYPLVHNTITITDLANNRLGFNQIANVASAVLDCRLLPETEIDRFLKS
jgi:carboxypeptidase PM20D1